MLRVGITGNIGSGKSTVCNIFESLNIPIFYADLQAKAIYKNYPELQAQVINLLGPDSFLSPGDINKSYVRNAIFNNPILREKLNQIVHPFVFHDFDVWCQNQFATLNPPYIIKEAAILFESGANKTVDLAIGVLAPLETKIQRVKTRDHITTDEALSRIHAQWDENQWSPLCAFTIQNNGEQPLIPQVLEIHKQLLHRAAHPELFPQKFNP